MFRANGWFASLGLGIWSISLYSSWDWEDFFQKSQTRCAFVNFSSSLAFILPDTWNFIFLWVTLSMYIHSSSYSHMTGNSLYQCPIYVNITRWAHHWSHTDEYCSVEPQNLCNSSSVTPCMVLSASSCRLLGMWMMFMRFGATVLWGRTQDPRKSRLQACLKSRWSLSFWSLLWPCYWLVSTLPTQVRRYHDHLSCRVQKFATIWRWEDVNPGLTIMQNFWLMQCLLIKVTVWAEL